MNSLTRLEDLNNNETDNKSECEMLVGDNNEASEGIQKVLKVTNQIDNSTLVYLVARLKAILKMWTFTLNDLVILMLSPVKLYENLLKWV
ncbi:11015_t:CDS:2 [Racocetra fulgida]|uniref:11015_t:CDS:1 n=1 Tax=Racocetra fulgida TaxID=60492 RepID=A0A9N9C8C3_9GLOM|nr:11015_t:CDS:2 [Racocetra fulgida]